MGAVGDGRAHLRGGVRLAGVVPLEPLAPRDSRFQILEVVGRRRQQSVEVILALAPVRQRKVVVDADEVAVRIGPERIEMEAQLAPAGPVA